MFHRVVVLRKVSEIDSLPERPPVRLLGPDPDGLVVLKYRLGMNRPVFVPETRGCAP